MTMEHSTLPNDLNSLKIDQACPLCSTAKTFNHWSTFRDAFVSLTTRSFDCPLCLTSVQGVDKFALHLVSHDLRDKVALRPTYPELKNNQMKEHQSFQPIESSIPELSIKEDVPSAVNPEQAHDALDELLQDFTEFVKQEDKTPLPVVAPEFPHLINNPMPPAYDNEMWANSAAQMNHNNGLTLSTFGMDSKQQDSKIKKSYAKATKCEKSESSVHCELCGWNFDNEKFLQLHKVLMHSPHRTRLNDCHPDDSRLRRLKNEFRCRECNLVFSECDEFTHHLKSVHNDHRHACNVCAKLFKLRGSLLVHQRVVHNPIGEDRAFHCRTCNRKFSNKYRRDNHEKRHGDSRHFDCEKCDLSFEEKGEYEVHIETHINMHRCDVCQESFNSESALVVHSVSCHKQTDIKAENDMVAACDLQQFHRSDCKQEPFSGPQSVSTFEGSNPPSVDQNDAAFSCKVCDKKFKKEAHLNQHVQTHEVKQWDCDVCKKSFTTKYFLKKHKRLHTGLFFSFSNVSTVKMMTFLIIGETPYCCGTCGKSFTFQQSYHKHMLYHTDEKPYTCAQCGRSFKELSTLQNHERIHSGERPFACETCGKSFRQRVSYLVHR